MPMLAFTSSFDWHSLELQYTMDYKKQIFTLKMDGSMNVNRNFNISVIQVRMDQGLVVKIRCPMRS